jgi:hypothetical protein
MNIEDTIGVIATIGIVIIFAIFVSFTMVEQEARKNYTQQCNSLDGIVILIPSGLECVSKDIVIKKK